MSVIATIVLAQTGSKAFAPLIPVIAALVGGILTAGGGFLANYFQLSTSREMERRQFYRERLEQIYLWVNQVVSWMEGESELYEMQRPARVATEEEKMKIHELRAEGPENPIYRLRMSADFYLPELTPQISSLGECVESFSASLKKDEPDEADAYYRRAQEIRTGLIHSIKPLVRKYL
jgi:hypothetical protein